MDYRPVYDELVKEFNSRCRLLVLSASKIPWHKKAKKKMIRELNTLTTYLGSFPYNYDIDSLMVFWFGEKLTQFDYGLRITCRNIGDYERYVSADVRRYYDKYFGFFTCVKDKYLNDVLYDKFDLAVSKLPVDVCAIVYSYVFDPINHMKVYRDRVRTFL